MERGLKFARNFTPKSNRIVAKNSACFVGEMHVRCHCSLSEGQESRPPRRNERTSNGLQRVAGCGDPGKLRAAVPQHGYGTTCETHLGPPRSDIAARERSLP